MSVFRDLSWTSSTIITQYRFNSGSISISLSRIPSVIYFSLVFPWVTFSSNRMEYPTVSPKFVPISSVTRDARLVAAIRLGCVTATKV